MAIKRLRIFAGPNGSGKSTITKIVKDSGVSLGLYINADEIKRSINEELKFNLNDYGILFDLDRFFEDFKKIEDLYINAGGDALKGNISFDGNNLCFKEKVNDYFTSYLSKYLRDSLLETCSKFTFETVMSHKEKLGFIKTAKEKGFRIYLYFVSLEDPSLNIERVASRVELGGHDVPEDKIKQRYKRCMDLLFDAVILSDKVYFFDNSYSTPKMFALVENGQLQFDKDIKFMPGWFKIYMIDKLEKE